MKTAEEIDKEIYEKRYAAYPLLVHALKGTLLSFMAVTPDQEDLARVDRASNLLRILGEKWP